MQLKKISSITGSIRLVTGLHIGEGKDSIEIGGLDQPIIKHPLSGEPYIPGSSFKGKIRSLLENFKFIERPETREWLMKGKPCGCGEVGCPACTIFGAHSNNQQPELGPSRIIVRDGMLTAEFAERFRSGKLPMEVKYENIINRVKGIAEHPRPLERVPAGVAFNLNISFKVFEGDSKDLLTYVFQGLKLIELDALGGCSSRGSGQVAFENLQCDGQDVKLDTISL
jgi:CRISPR-associated protein Csm3